MTAPGWVVNDQGGLVPAGPLRCPSCGTDSLERECPDWCPRLGGCDCRQALCGVCMRGGGTSLSGIPVQ